MVRMLVPILMMFALPALADDNGRVSFLEAEVRNLKRDVQALTRQVDELRTRPARIAPQSTDKQAAAPVDELPLWIDAVKWKKLRPG